MSTPNWNRTAASFDDQTYWTDTGNAVNPTAGYWTTRRFTYSNQLSDYGARYGSLTPDFFGRQKRGDYIFPLSYDAVYIRQSAVNNTRVATTGIRYNTGGAAVWYYREDTRSYKENVYQYSWIPNPVLDNTILNAMTAKANQKVLDRLKQTSVNLAVAYAEREQTVKTVTNTVQTIAKTLHNLGRGNFSGAARALGVNPPKRASRRFRKEWAGAKTANDVTNAVTNGWLGLQYGWKPLLKDVYDASEFLARKSPSGRSANAIRSSVSGSGSWQEDVTTLEYPVIPPQFQGFDAILRKATSSCRVTTKVWFEESSPVVHDLASLGITNPLLVAWELVPYSFVVDWFLPIGNWLGNLDATNGLTFKSGTTSSMRKWNPRTTRVQFLTDASRPGTVRQENYRAAQDWKWFLRSTLSGFPANPRPRFKNPLSYSHMMSAFSLLKQFKR